MEHNIPELVAQLTLEEKAGLCSGADFWHTKAVERLGIPTLMVSDGPHGLRTQDPERDDPNHSRKAVCFPAGCSAAASFDPDLARREGAAIGREARAFGVGVVLGPAINIKRSPLCGRNFEYYSEDPVLAGELAAGYINGVQSQGVGTSIKHFAANSQEYRRMSASSDMTERTLREIYLPAFETAVKKSQPWTVMCSYNRVNDVFASENRMLLTDILRTEWNFKGFVMAFWQSRRCILPCCPFSAAAHRGSAKARRIPWPALRRWCGRLSGPAPGPGRQLRPPRGTQCSKCGSQPCSARLRSRCRL